MGARARPRHDAVAIVAAFGYGWYISGAVNEGRDLLEAVLAAPGATSARRSGDRPQLVRLAAPVRSRDASSDVVDHAERAVELARGTRLAGLRAFAAVIASLVRGFRGLTDEAVALIDEAAARLDDEPDTWAQAWVDWARSGLALKVGDPEPRPQRDCAHSVSAFEADGDRAGWRSRRSG